MKLTTQCSTPQWPAGRFAATLRRQLYKEHLGLLEPRSGLLQRDEPTRSMLPVTIPQEDTTGTEADQLVSDPMSPQLVSLWTDRARTNTQAFRKVFRPVPAAGILTWNDYKGTSAVCLTTCLILVLAHRG